MHISCCLKESGTITRNYGDTGNPTNYPNCHISILKEKIVLKFKHIHLSKQILIKTYEDPNFYKIKYILKAIEHWRAQNAEGHYNYGQFKCKNELFLTCYILHTYLINIEYDYTYLFFCMKLKSIKNIIHNMIANNIKYKYTFFIKSKNNIRGHKRLHILVTSILKLNFIFTKM